MTSQDSNSIQIVKIKFNSFDEYISWAIEKLKDTIPEFSGGKVINEASRGSYRLVTYAFNYNHGNLITIVKIDFEMESDFEWYTGNKQEDPDWVYFPQKEEYQIWGGVKRLALKLQGTPVNDY